MGVTKEELTMLNGPEAVIALCRRNVLPGMTFALDANLRDAALPVPLGWSHDNWLSFVAGSMGRLKVIRESNYLDYRQHRGNTVGAGSKTIRRRVRRLFSLPNDAERLNTAFTNATSRLKMTSVSDKTFARIAAKAEFERSRARLPRESLRREIAVLRLMADGGYREFSSNGNWNAFRDLIHRG
jgi:hypothetical protein